MDNINNNDNTIDLRKLFSIIGEQKKVIIPIISDMHSARYYSSICIAKVLSVKYTC